MFENKHVIAAIVVTILIFGLLAWGVAQASPDIKLCKNFETGEIYVVEANMPCPYPSVEI